mmetsp:Transcript_66007/g.157828  ORF Transcript_66007/g.157828 Transcript_66007/m.157828 type:complete len:94 (-) Transcript_66007:103-384(-)
MSKSPDGELLFSPGSVNDAGDRELHVLHRHEGCWSNSDKAQQIADVAWETLMQARQTWDDKEALKRITFRSDLYEYIIKGTGDGQFLVVRWSV